MSKQRLPEEAIGEIVGAKGNLLDLNSLVAEIVTAFHGMKALANLLSTLYEELPAKSPSRERLLSNVFRLICMAKMEPPSTDASPEELKAIMQEVVGMEADE